MPFQEFFAMNGYGGYVWGSYGIALVVFVALFISVKAQRKNLVKQLRRHYKLKDKQQNKLREVE